jgi:hypothetical protein
MKKALPLLMACLLFVLFVTGCSSSNISQEDYDAVVAERDSLSKERDSLSKENEFLKNKLEKSQDSSQSSSFSAPKSITAESIVMHFLDKITYTNGIQVWDDASDPNGLLGYFGEYSGKADFSDKRIDQSGSVYLVGGSVETFSSQKDCADRYTSLKDLADQKVINQYMYKYDTVLLRIDALMSQDDAEKYLDTLNNYLGKKPILSYIPQEESSVPSVDETSSGAEQQDQSSETGTADIPQEYRSALAKAKTYSDTMHMSKAGLYDQLTSEYGEKFSAEAAQYAVDHVQADWNRNALEKAKIYQQSMNMSPAAIWDQLVSEYGEQFTKEEADYAIENLPQ